MVVTENMVVTESMVVTVVTVRASAVVMRVVDDAHPADLEHTAGVGAEQVLLGEHLPGRARRDDSAGEQHHGVRDGRFAEVVCAEHDRPAAVALAAHDLEDPLARHEVEPGHRLVEHQQRRLGRQPLRDQHTLALSPRQLEQLALCQIGDLESVHRLLDRRPPVGADSSQEPADAVAAHRHDLVDRERQLRRHLCRLQHVGDVAAAGTPTEDRQRSRHGRRRPLVASSRLDFPLPFGPMQATSVPEGTTRSERSSATWSPWARTRALASIAGTSDRCDMRISLAQRGWWRPWRAGAPRRPPRRGPSCGDHTGTRALASSRKLIRSVHADASEIAAA